MKPNQTERKKDEEILMVLHLTDVEGWTCSKAGEIYGMTKNAVIGARNRIRKTADCFDGCKKSKNKDYNLKPLWWRNN